MEARTFQNVKGPLVHVLLYQDTSATGKQRLGIKEQPKKCCVKALRGN
jgi:hypothetical protein